MSSIGKRQEIQIKPSCKKIARGTMLLRGLLADFSTECLQELAGIRSPARAEDAPLARDLRNLLWASIDKTTRRIWIS